MTLTAIVPHHDCSQGDTTREPIGALQGSAPVRPQRQQDT